MTASGMEDRDDLVTASGMEDRDDLVTDSGITEDIFSRETAMHI